ncbi:dihydrofolate reductase family protein [Mycobacterium sp. E2989]|uniref:dihydrofolate reductase family protein n=1 Tax=Mycobacterium sp. E2989 TaxID=1834140 RepID=UPI00080068C5|nr:dihydrofolate reductase family protein [Mycobacterium sp. E2989]OBH87232.1 deaminase [Mycobacterium sp. E2989]
MGTLCYTATVSLDGYAADGSGDFQWSAPSDPVFAAHIDRMAEVSTEVLGRKTFALMQYWETDPEDEEWGAAEREFAQRWRCIHKVVVSSTLTREEIDSDRVRLVPELRLAELKRIVAQAEGIVEIFGPTTAAAAIRAGLIDEFQFFVVPKMVGAGLRALPDGVRQDLSLASHSVFDDGTVHLRFLSRRDVAR